MFNSAIWGDRFTTCACCLCTGLLGRRIQHISELVSKFMMVPILLVLSDISNSGHGYTTRLASALLPWLDCSCCCIHVVCTRTKDSFQLSVDWNVLRTLMCKFHFSYSVRSQRTLCFGSNLSTSSMSVSKMDKFKQQHVFHFFNIISATKSI